MKRRFYLGTAARKEARRRFKVRLWQEQLGLCHWCGQPITLYDFGPKERHMPRDAATFDHLDDRFSPERGKHPGKVRKVLACWQCNNDRGAESQRAQPIEELHRRSGSYPRAVA